MTLWIHLAKKYFIVGMTRGGRGMMCIKTGSVGDAEDIVNRL